MEPAAYLLSAARAAQCGPRPGPPLRGACPLRYLGVRPSSYNGLGWGGVDAYLSGWEGDVPVDDASYRHTSLRYIEIVVGDLLGSDTIANNVLMIVLLVLFAIYNYLAVLHPFNSTSVCL